MKVFRAQLLALFCLLQIALYAQDSTLFDPLEDFTLIEEHSANLTFDTINRYNFGNDSSRLIRTNLENAFLTYAFDSITDFSVEFWVVDGGSGTITVSHSNDGITFEPIDLNSATEDFGYRDRITYTPKALIGYAQYLKIELTGGNGNWKGQIGSVEISNFGSVRTGPNTFYIDAINGSDENEGTSPGNAFLTLQKMNETGFFPGDSLLLHAGHVFYGSLQILTGGTQDDPVYVGGYGGEEKPVINAAGYLAGIRIANAAHIEVDGIEITADAGKPVESQAAESRYGIYITSSIAGIYSNFSFRNLDIHHIFATEEVDSDGQNPTSNMGMAFNIQMQSIDALIKHITIENCDLAMIGHTGIRIFGTGPYPGSSYIDSVFIFNNRLTHIGGPGMVPGKCSNVIVRGNTVNYSGSSADLRMHNRGSGIWPWTSKNVLIEKNEFRNAWGKYDSCGAHIDFNCRNVVIQHNLSYNNAGGFVEILGNDTECVYRYNISINDGYRKNGVNGALSDGHMFWLSAYTGQGEEYIGANHCRVYNNTIYVGAEIATGIRFENRTHDNQVENNIIYIDGEMEFLDKGQNNTLNNNIWYGNTPQLNYGDQAVFADPQLINPGDTLSASYMIMANSPAINTGLTPADQLDTDFWGDLIDNGTIPDRGADESDYDPTMHTIESSAEAEGGQIFPAGSNAFPQDATIPLKIMAYPGFDIEKVLVDGTETGSSDAYTFENLDSNHEIEVQFYAAADSVTDPLNDYSMLWEYGGNSVLYTDSPENFEGDVSRMARNSLDPGNLVYRYKEITGFEVVYWGVNDDNGTVSISMADSSGQFTEIETREIDHTNYGWRYKSILGPKDSIPEGTWYIKFSIDGSDAGWKTQIGSVEISWLGDDRFPVDTSSVHVPMRKQMFVYPNPTGDRIFIKESHQISEYDIYSLQGDLVKKCKGPDPVDISDLETGIYFLKAEGYRPVRFIRIRN